MRNGNYFVVLQKISCKKPMPANKNALIRYKTIDNCLRNPYRRWTLEDLVEACCDALYDCEGIRKGVSVRTVQGDIQMMRSDKLGYNAPIVVYENKYYKYEDPDFSIMDMPLSQNDYLVMQEAVDMLRQLQDFNRFAEISDVVSRLQDKLSVSSKARKPLIHFDSVPDLKGLQLLNPLYNIIARQQVVKITYLSFNASQPTEYILHPHLLKEFRNRWFLFGSQYENDFVKPDEPSQTCLDYAERSRKSQRNRTFKNMKLLNLPLDRIEAYEVMDKLQYRDNPAFDTEHFFDDVIGVSKNIGDKAHHIVFWTSPRQSKYISTKPLHPSQQLVQRHEDGSCTFSMDVVINRELYSVLMSYGAGICVLEPKKSARFMAENLENLVKQYNKEDTTE